MKSREAHLFHFFRPLHASFYTSLHAAVPTSGPQFPSDAAADGPDARKTLAMMLTVATLNATVVQLPALPAGRPVRRESGSRAFYVHLSPCPKALSERGSVAAPQRAPSHTRARALAGALVPSAFIATADAPQVARCGSSAVASEPA